MARTVGNSFYQAAELIVALSAINLTQAVANDPDASLSPEARVFSALCVEIIEVSRHITELFGEIVGMMTGGLGDLEMTTEHVPDGPKLSTFCLPYFFDEVDAVSQFGRSMKPWQRSSSSARAEGSALRP